MTLPWYERADGRVQVQAAWYRGTSAWLPVKAIWYRTGGEWRKVHEWYTPPTESVSGVNIVTFGLDPIDVTVEWTQVTNPVDARYLYDVNIEWYVDGALYGSYNVDQEIAASHTITLPYAFGVMPVYARVRYGNPAGNGPWVTSATVYV